MRANEPAFPTHSHDQAAAAYTDHPGMTLRDWFAGQALAGLVGRYGVAFDVVSEAAYQLADVMIARREKPWKPKEDTK